MAVNPCCMPLQRGVIIMAIIDIVFAIFDLVVVILAIIAVTVNRDDHPELENEEITVTIVVCIILLIIAILGLLLSIRLYFGAQRRDIRNCRLWLIVKLVLFCIDLISLIVNFSAGDAGPLGSIVAILIMVYRIYMMYVVYCFIQELKLDLNRFAGGVTFAMHNYPPQNYPHQQPTVFISSNAATLNGGNPPPYSAQYPPPYSADLRHNQQAQNGLYNPNSQYYTTNNV
ncbi:uncharacterized protein LOC110860572 [Folsomia candida]|uniref:Uncharacterized protein n=1 Tax=Folsomia candida TaxID=158441 RepID=A0A226D5L7_FOLCA|nr:uncharacterized protein LOC110860572 [Folsomia candida]OXA40473.1 hypothetical protein Fcan01_24659 [Folsomia candida]